MTREALRAAAVAVFVGLFVAAVANAHVGCGGASSQEPASPEPNASTEEVMFPATKSGSFLPPPEQQQAPNSK